MYLSYVNGAELPQRVVVPDSCNNGLAHHTEPKSKNPANVLPPGRAAEEGMGRPVTTRASTTRQRIGRCFGATLHTGQEVGNQPCQKKHRDDGKS
jgi:hypothetical protein